MRKVSAETPSRIQQSVIGTDATKPVGRGLATGRGAVRITPAGAELKDALPLNFTVAFIGLSGLAPMRAGSLHGAAGAVTEAGGGGNEVGALEEKVAEQTAHLLPSSTGEARAAEPSAEREGVWETNRPREGWASARPTAAGTEPEEGRAKSNSALVAE